LFLKDIMKFILASKIDMTAMWVGEERKAVTRVQAGPAVVVQVKGKDKDGYTAVQLGFGNKKIANISKPQVGHYRGMGNFRYLKEFRLEKAEDLKIGDKIGAATFAVGDKVKVTGWTKGRGFAGVVKRHGFHGQDKTHGNKDQLRMPGSIGAGGVQRVFKGMRMGGHMGDAQATFQNIKVIEVDEVNNIIFLEGGLPGGRGGLLLLQAPGELQIITAEVKEVAVEPVEVAEEVTAASAESSVEPKEDLSSEALAKEEPTVISESADAEAVADKPVTEETKVEETKE
jgi:large subunit ribosomal protein L3